MKLNTRHLIISVTLLVGSIIYNIWVFTRPADGTAAGNRAAPSDVVAAAPPPGASGSAAVPIDPSQVTPLPEVDLDRLPEWPRDPFANQRPQQPEVVDTGGELEPVVVDDADPVVGSILYSADRRLATVDGRIVRAGDRIGNATVVEILPNAVVIESPERGRRTLSMRPPGSGLAPQ